MPKQIPEIIDCELLEILNNVLRFISNGHERPHVDLILLPHTKDDKIMFPFEFGVYEKITQILSDPHTFQIKIPGIGPNKTMCVVSPMIETIETWLRDFDFTEVALFVMDIMSRTEESSRSKEHIVGSEKTVKDYEELLAECKTLSDNNSKYSIFHKDIVSGVCKQLGIEESGLFNYLDSPRWKSADRKSSPVNNVSDDDIKDKYFITLKALLTRR